MSVYEEIFQKHGLSKTQQEIVDIVGFKKSILEIGPSAGYMTRAFLNNLCIVDIVEQDKRVFSKIPQNVRNKFLGSIEDDRIIANLKKDYEYIILADVLEHLLYPEIFLKNIAKIVSTNTKLIISLPNIASWVMRKQLFCKGDFQYQDSGLLDKTHLHFYTVNSLPLVLFGNGWKVEKIIGTIIRMPFQGILGKLPLLGIVYKKIIYPLLVNKFKNLAYYHFITVARKK